MEEFYNHRLVWENNFIKFKLISCYYKKKIKKFISKEVLKNGIMFRIVIWYEAN